MTCIFVLEKHLRKKPRKNQRLYENTYGIKMHMGHELALYYVSYMWSPHSDTFGALES